MSAIIRQRSATLQRFTGGLNNFWDQSSIDDSELYGITNFEFSSNGALISRPPVYPEKNGTTLITTPVASEPVDIIGVYVRQDGRRFLVCITMDKTWIYDIISKTWTQIATFRASDCTQYDNKIVLCSTTTHGGYWEAGTFTSTPSMPFLGGIELFQNRFFGFGVENSTTANTIYWSDITTFGPSGTITSIWDWIDGTGNYFYVEIGTGDGQWITAIAQGYNDLVIFRNRSTYRYSYGDTPEYGTMQVMQQDIGAESKRSVVKFENAHFVLSGGILYRYQNWMYYPLNAQRVKMGEYTDFDHRFEHAVSIVGRRCLVWHNGAMYAYNLDTETWSEWQSDTRIAYFVTVPRLSEENLEQLYYGISGDVDPAGAGVTDYCLYRIEDKPTSVNGTETFKCSLQTKIYDFNTPVEWKRLFFWTADIQTYYPVKAAVYPVAIPEMDYSVTWDQLSKDYPLETSFYTWDMISKDGPTDITYGTWDAITRPSGGIETLVTPPNYGVPLRTEVKLNQALRFRRIYFELYLDCDGTALTSPVQVFSITPMVGGKAKIAKGAN